MTQLTIESLDNAERTLMEVITLHRKLMDDLISDHMVAEAQGACDRIKAMCIALNVLQVQKEYLQQMSDDAGLE